MTDAPGMPAGTGRLPGAVRFDTDRAPARARFDDDLDAWVLSRYADVAAALRDARLSPAGGGTDDRAAHDGLRESAALALAPDLVHEWRATIFDSARRAVDRLPVGRPVDLMTAFAQPWSRDLAMMVAGADPANADTLGTHARDIFLAAAHATGSQRDPSALAATAALARALPASDPAIAVQAFIALAETLPCTLAGVWLELFDRPESARHLRELLHPQTRASSARGSLPDSPADTDARVTTDREEKSRRGVDVTDSEPNGIGPQIIEELLRLASPDRAVFRQARADLSIGGVRIKAADRVILSLAAANRDPAAFPRPDKVDPSRTGPPHLTFGRGAHRCAGTSVVRMAITIATATLLESTSSIEIAGDIEWLDGFAIRAPSSLPVMLHRGAVDAPLAVHRADPVR